MTSRVCHAILIGALWSLAAACAPPPDPPAIESSDIFLPADTEVLESRVPRNATLAGLLRGYQLQDDLVHRLIEATREVFDPRQLRANQTYRVVRTLDGWLRRFEYEMDATRFLRVLHDPEEPGRFEVEVVPIEREAVVTAAAGVIDERRTSLVAAMNDAGEGIVLALALAEVFSGEIDFNSDLRRGDGFGVVFEKLHRDEEFAGYGDVLATWFRNGNRTVQAYRFHVPGEQEPGYYDEEGRSLKRFFLKSPLPFTPRITSGFSRSRLHPVHGFHRAHLGVDYAAPTGTPVVAVAAGTVVAAGWAGEAGRRIHLRHAGGYETFYLHLSSFARGIGPGARVAQGQFIGRVGMTGTATGPHLDYRIRRDGTFVDPVAEHRRMPPGEPIPAEHLAAFMEVRDVLAEQFDLPESGSVSGTLTAN